MTTRNISKLFISMTTVVIVFFVLSCTGNGQHRTKRDADSLAIRIALLPTVESLPFYYAEAEGIFDSIGVNVQLITFEAAMDADTAFAGQSADGILTDLVKACTWQATGDSVKVVVANELKLWLVTASQARIRNTESLKEKIIGITRHSAIDYWTDALLASAKLGSEQLNKPQINNLHLRAQMVVQNQYDGAVMPEPYATICANSGAFRLTDGHQLKATNPMCALLFREPTLSKQKAEIAQIVEAYSIAAYTINQRTNGQLSRQWLSYIPQSAQWPDSLVVTATLGQPSLPTDSLISRVSAWAKQRTLIQSDVTQTMLNDTAFLPNNTSEKHPSK